MITVPLLKKIYLLQYVWKEEPFGGTVRMTLSPGKDEDVRWKLTPHSSLKLFETTFPSKCWLWIPYEAHGPCRGRKDKHCKAVYSCMAGETLKLDYTQRHTVFQHPNLLIDPDQCSLHCVVSPDNPWGWHWHAMSRMYRYPYCCWCHMGIERLSISTGTRKFNILC